MNLEKPRRSAYASRPDYDELLTELASCDHPDAVDILMRDRADLIQTFPESWEEFIEGEAAYRKTELQDQINREAQNAFT